VSDVKTPLRGKRAGRADRDQSEGRRLAAPGRLLAGDVGVVEPGAQDQQLTEYAQQHGLQPSARRPPMGLYVRQLWHRRHFMLAFATARNIAMYTEARLGQLWQVLTPLLNAGVYYLIFGPLLHVDRGIPDYLGFVVTGVFVFNFTQRALITTSKVMNNSLPLIRALQFPRASLPLAYVLIEFQQFMLSMIVLIPILLLTGEPMSWHWLLAIPALALQSIFNVGIGLLSARLGSQVDDFSQLLPFLTRTWLYMSGVIFSIATLNTSRWVRLALEINPAALYITLTRNALMATQRESAPGSKPTNKALCDVWKHLGHNPSASKQFQYYSAYCHNALNPAHYWYYAIGWAVVAVIVGFWFFWRAETRYGRG
jgi:teichoic acid transport system permease protein